MKSIMITLGIMLITALNSYAAGNVFSNEGSIEKTHIKNNKRMPDLAYQAELRQRPAWQNFLQKHSTWYVEFNEENAKPHRAYGKPIPAFGKDAESRAIYFINNELIDFNIPVDDLHLMGTYSTKKHLFVNFYQVLNGLKVLYSRFTIKMTIDGRVILFGADVYDDINISITPEIPESSAISFAQQDIPETILSGTANPDLFILPVPGDKSNQYKLVYEVMVETIDADEIPARYYTLVDAASGEVLYRQNMVKHLKKPAPPTAPLANVEVNMSATLYPTHSYNPATVNPLTNMRININATNYNTDTIGNLVTAITTSTTGTFFLDGLWADVETGNVTPSFTASLVAGPNTVSFDANSTIQQRTAYYHVNVVHDYMKSLLPLFTGMDFSLTTNVDVTGTCNAFYSGTSINFYSAGGGCNSFATVGDVVYHEYGHGINDNFYSSQGGFFQNGAMGEGYSDVWGFAITLNPILGLGNSSTDPNDFIRRYDINPKVYPIDIIGEVHADGEIIAGAWWDTYLNLGSNMNTTMQLFAEAYPGLQAQTPDGNEGQAFRDVLLDVLQADDNDADLTNGTPNGVAICGAFGIHGITLISNATLTHTALEQSSANLPITINATLNISDTTYLGDVLLFYKVNTNPTWNTVVMTKTGGFNYTGDIPAQVVGTVVSYYLGVEDNTCGNLSAVIPIGAADTDPNIPYYILVGYDLKATEDFDFSLGAWSYGMPGDLATTGMWELTIPLGSFGTPGDPSTMVAPDYQHTPGGQFCAVTQRASSASAGIGESDVDGGHTTLKSPVFDLSSYSNPVFTYFRWYVNNPPSGANPNADWWQVQVSNDGTNWVAVEGTKVSDRSWRRFAFRVQDYITPTATTQIRFIASDSIRPGQYLDGGSLVEGALDDLQLWDETISVNIGNDTTICGGDAIVLDAGNPGATYLWSTGATTQTITVTSSDTIWVTVNSIAADTIIVTVPSLLNISTSFNSASCGLCDGNATITPSGGTPPYLYLWNPGAQTDSIATNLCASAYSVLVTDANGCTNTSSVTVTGPGGLTSSITASTGASCIGVCDGDATVTATGGAAPYTYSWDTGDTLQTQTGLCAGTYTASVIDSNGCLTSATVVIAAPQVINLTSTVNGATLGNNDGSATVTPTGGTFPYDYSWNTIPVQTTATATGLATGIYIVQVTDAAGCVNSITVDVPQVTGINQYTIINNQLKVYPNPNNGQFVIEFSNETKEETLIEVRNIIGQLIYTEQVSNVSGNFTKQIDLFGHNQGVYLLSISNSSGTRTEKLIIY